MQKEETDTSQHSFRLLVAGQIITLLGSALLRFALSLYVLDVTGRADIFSVLYAISTIPLLLSPIGGAISDRVNRRNLMVAIDFVNGLITVIFFITMLNGHNSVFLIGAVMVLLGVTSAMESPTVMACVPSIVSKDKLENANGIISGISSLAQIIAPVLGGLLYGTLGLNPLVVFSFIAFFIASIMEVFIKIPYSKREQEKHIVPTIFDDMKAGFRYTFKEAFILKCMVLAAVLNLFLSPFFIVGVPVILRVTMESTDMLYGIGMAITEFGMILGAMSVGVFAKKMKISTVYRWLIGIAILMIPLAVSLLPMILKLGYYPSFILFFLFALPVLMILTSISIYIITQVQRETPNALLGKVMATIMAVAQCAAPMGQIIYGFLFETFSLASYIPTMILSLLTLAIALSAKIMLKKEGNINGASSKY